VTGACVRPERCEGVVDGGVPAFRRDALDLLDQDAAGQRGFQLAVLDVRLFQGALLEDRDGGDVGECLGERDVVVAETLRCGLEEAERTDDPAAQAQRDGVCAHIPRLACACGEAWPAN